MRVGETTYNYAGVQRSEFVDCSTFFAPQVGYSRFAKSQGPFGDGVKGFVLVPYRTIAADPKFLKTGLVLYIPSAVGQPLPAGKIHDGYFFVADRGGAIRGNHIDIFNGDQVVPFFFVLSKPHPLFRAYIISDPSITEALYNLHGGR